MQTVCGIGNLCRIFYAEKPQLILFVRKFLHVEKGILRMV